MLPLQADARSPLSRPNCPAHVMGHVQASDSGKGSAHGIEMSTCIATRAHLSQVGTVILPDSHLPHSVQPQQGRTPWLAADLCPVQALAGISRNAPAQVFAYAPVLLSTSSRYEVAASWTSTDAASPSCAGTIVVSRRAKIYLYARIPGTKSKPTWIK